MRRWRCSVGVLLIVIRHAVMHAAARGQGTYHFLRCCDRCTHRRRTDEDDAKRRRAYIISPSRKCGKALAMRTTPTCKACFHPRTHSAVRTHIQTDGRHRRRGTKIGQVCAAVLLVVRGTYTGRVNPTVVPRAACATFGAFVHAKMHG